MKSFFIHGVGLCFSGVDDWNSGREVLLGRREPGTQGFNPKAPPILPANERRRLTTTIRLALQVAWEAVQNSGFPAATLGSVFVSNEGDGTIIDQICSTLAHDPALVSPTVFHNSVHNAPAGYWTISVGATLPSTTLSTYNGCVAAGLLESATQLASARSRLLLVFYDVPPPSPLLEKRALAGAFGAALVLSSEPAPGALGAISIELCETTESSRADTPDLEKLRQGNPAARCLPLLAALADSRGGRVMLPFTTGCSLRVELSPCG